VRFEVTNALDAIEQRLSTDPLVTGAVVDLAEAVRLPGLDVGRPANLLRLGVLIDGLSRQFADSGVALYGVAERGLLSDPDLTSNERMVLRRWSDDGLVEIIPAGMSALDRVCEVGLALDQPVLTAAQLRGFPGAWMTPLPVEGAVSLLPAGSPPRRPATVGGVLSRLWRCPEPGCPSFDPNRSPSQPPPQLSADGVPGCPRHAERLTDVGPRPYAVPAAVRIDGVVRSRFALHAGRPVSIGRAPDGPDGVGIAEYLDERAGRWVSRSHLRLELADDTVVATDLSTNGCVLLARPDPAAPPRRSKLPAGQPVSLGEWDAVELHEHVEVFRADRMVSVPVEAEPGSVMVDAPTIALRLPRTR